jgi:RNA polymerase sigma-70 factor, ECF subfamily
VNGQENRSTGEVTQLVRLLGSGQEQVKERLFELVYDELRRIAGARMKAERTGHTLTPTALVNEAYVRLNGGSDLKFEDRAHFLSVVARAMRRVLVDHARARRAAKRDDKALRDLEWLICANESDDRILAMDQALTELDALNQRQSRVVEYRYFAGLAEEEVAAVLGVTRRTVTRDWAIARAWLYTRLQENITNDGGTVARS